MTLKFIKIIKINQQHPFFLPWAFFSPFNLIFFLFGLSFVVTFVEPVGVLCYGFSWDGPFGF